MTKTEQHAEQVARVYERLIPAGEWASTADLSDHLDLTVEQFGAAVAHLARTGWVLAPESNQKVMTERDHEWGVWFGGQWKHLLASSY